MVLGNQQAAECLQIATQDGQLHVTFKADLRMVATALQRVAALQRSDRRFDAGVVLLSGEKFFSCCGPLHHRLLGSRLGQAQVIDQFRQGGLVVGRMKPTVE